MQIEDLIFSQKRTKGGLDFAYLGVSQVKSLPIAESAACSGLFDPNKFVWHLGRADQSSRDRQMAPAPVSTTGCKYKAAVVVRVSTSVRKPPNFKHAGDRATTSTWWLLTNREKK